MLSFIIGILGFALMGFDFTSALGVAAATLGNVGPALENLAPMLPTLHFPATENFGRRY